MKFKRGIIFFIIIFLGIFLLFNFFNLGKKDSLEDLIIVNSTDVVDCANKELGCIQREIYYNYIDCSSRYEDKATSSEEAGCKKTKVGLEKIGLIADHGNFVPFKFTKENFTVELIKSNLKAPWDTEFLPDDSILITQKSGEIISIRGGIQAQLLEVKTIDLKEGGLMGLAIDPNFSDNNFVYILYTYDFDREDLESGEIILGDIPITGYSIDDGIEDFSNKKSGKIKLDSNGNELFLNRISRLVFKDGYLSSEEILLEGIPASGWHSGGRLEIGPDNKLYATTGDGEEKKLAQENYFLGGKILRLNLDGSVPEDNPIADSYIYSKGHRNPQGLAWDIKGNRMYSSEHGYARFDEVNEILAGENYGWGGYQCDEVNSKLSIVSKDYVPPIRCSKTWTMAPSGMEFINDPNSPWYGSLFLATLRGKHLHRYNFEEGIDEIFFVSNGKNYFDGENKIDSRIRDVEYYNGSLYVIGDSHGLVRISPS